ncbi:hypothetical protein [Parasphingorhabdus sp.]|uniref:hypothetical protein n=1 Tax=Parasphingorhabdus sp. TaxID=2709688 RepID=UPI0010FF4A1D
MKMTYSICPRSLSSNGFSKDKDHFILPFHNLIAICLYMLGRLSSLMVIFALFFGTVILPSVAHAAAPEHSEGTLEQHGHDESSHSDQHEDEGDQPCHAVMHHHHNFALGSDFDTLRTQLTNKEGRARPSSSVAKPSWSQAPPTKPPFS